MKKSGRHLARRYALQALYQWQLSHTPPSEIELQFLTHQHMNKKTDFIYFKELIHAVPEYQTAVDQQMVPFLSRPIDELDPIELTILRLSIYELLKRADIPYRVVINEALELTKQFGSVEGYKFVNGILDHVAHQLRTVEIKAEKKKS